MIDELNKPVLIPSVHQRVCLNVTEDNLRHLKFIAEKAPEKITRDRALELYHESLSRKNKGDQLRSDFRVIMVAEYVRL